jgi:glycosyltransferase involved in cell wall biosynthesis
VSVLAGQNGAQRRELEKLTAALVDLKPTLVHLPNLMFVGVVRSLKRILDAQVVCTLAGEDVFIDALAEPYRSEARRLIRQAVSAVDAFVAPTRYYAAHATECYGLDDARVHYVPMGIQVDDAFRAPEPPRSPFTIGYLAAVCPEKGLATLCDAFVILKERRADCRLRIAGYVGQSGRRYWNEIHERLSAGGLRDGVDFLGEVTGSQKRDFLRSLHVLSVPTVYPEAKGLYVLESMASGVPVVQPRHGSFTELVEDTGGGILYDPSGPEALADAIAEVMNDESLRQRLAENGRSAVGQMYTDEVMAERTWSVYETLRQRSAAPAASGAIQATGG